MAAQYCATGIVGQFSEKNWERSALEWPRIIYCPKLGPMGCICVADTVGLTSVSSQD